MKNKLLKAVMLIAVLFSLFSSSFSPLVNAASVYPSLEPGWEEIYAQDFDEDDTAGWTTLGGNSKLDFDHRFSKSGSASLICSDRTQIWEGPCLNVSGLLSPGVKYNFDIYVRQDSEDDHNVTLMMKYYNKNNMEEIYDQIGERSLSGNGWHRLTGLYTIPDDAVDYLIYLQHDDASVNFAIDCVLISGFTKEVTTTKEKEYQEITYDFEEGINSWTVTGDALLERSSNFSHSGRYALYTSERVTADSYPFLNVTSFVKPGISYEYSAFVMFNARAYADEHSFSLILRYKTDDEENDIVIDSKTLQKGNWSKLMGEFVLPEDTSAVSLFIQSNDAEKNDGLIAFYTDDVTIMDSTLKNAHELNSIMLKTALLIFGALGSATLFIVIFKKIGVSNTILADASSDSMTSALNRNSYELQIAHLESVPNDCRRLWVTVCDVNFLKHINDNYGHKKGDDAIIRCANVLTNTIGKKGVVYRTGGDEFICMTKGNFDSKLKEAFSVEAQQYKGYPFSVAVGTSCYLPEQDGSVPNIKLIVERSDVEMYKNKEELKKAMSGMM